MIMNLVERRQRGLRRLLYCAIIIAFALVCCWVLSVHARGDDTSWYINFETYGDSYGGLPTDLILIMGVRPSALDGYDLFDWPKPQPPL